MRHTRVIALLSAVLVIATSDFQLLAPVPGALIELDAARGVDKNEWQNLGTVGGEFPAGPNGAPNLEPAQGNEPARYTGEAGNK